MILTPPSREVISSLWRFLNNFHKNYWFFCMQHNLPNKPDMIRAHMIWGTNITSVFCKFFFWDSFFLYSLFSKFWFWLAQKTFSIFLGSLERIFLNPFSKIVTLFRKNSELDWTRHILNLTDPNWNFWIVPNCYFQLEFRAWKIRWLVLLNFIFRKTQKIVSPKFSIFKVAILNSTLASFYLPNNLTSLLRFKSRNFHKKLEINLITCENDGFWVEEGSTSLDYF